MDKQPFPGRKILDLNSRIGFDRQKGVKRIVTHNCFLRVKNGFCFSDIIRSFLSGRITTFSLSIMLPAFECKNPVLEYDFGHQSSTAFLFSCLHETVYFSFLALYIEKY